MHGAISKAALDLVFSAHQEALKEIPQMRYVSLTGKTGGQDTWYDEAHPSTAGFAIAAKANSETIGSIVEGNVRAQ